MSARDKTEKVLRDIHVLFSKAEPFENSKRKVVIDKMRMMNLLKDLNECMYDMMEEYELTEASREKAQLKVKRQNDELIFETRKNAEDIYAASLMYSDRSLSEIADVIKDADEKVKAIHEDMHARIRQELSTIKSNQFELKGQLQDLIDTQKYLRLIEEENARRARAEANGKTREADPSPTADVQVDIKINEDYFREQGYEELLENEGSSEDSDKVETEINVNLDAEYFAWKEEENAGEESEKEPREEKKRGGLFARLA